MLPTVLDLVGLPPQPGIDGRSLARVALRSRAPPSDRVAYSETYFPRYHFGWQHLRSLRDGAYKFIDAPSPSSTTSRRTRGETTNIYKAFSRAARPCALQLDGLTSRRRRPAPEQQQLDPETLQRLAALGYVGNVIDVDPRPCCPTRRTSCRSSR